MIEFLKQNYGNIIVVLVLIVLIVIATIFVRRNSGKCAGCAKASTCPFAKK